MKAKVVMAIAFKRNRPLVTIISSVSLDSGRRSRRRSSLLLGKSAPVLRLRTQTAAHASVVIAELRRLSEVIVVDAQPAEGGQDGANQGVDSVDEALKSSED